MSDPNQFFSPIQIVLLSVFPDIEEIFSTKLTEGYCLLSLTYKTDEQKRSEYLELILEKDSEQYRIKQRKEGEGSFSQVIFEIV